MTVTAIIRDHAVVLPEGLDLPEGTQVEVIVPEPVRSAEERQAQVVAWLEKSRGSATTGLTTDEIMRMSRGDDWGR